MDAGHRPTEWAQEKAASQPGVLPMPCDFISVSMSPSSPDSSPKPWSQGQVHFLGLVLIISSEDSFS